MARKSPPDPERDEDRKDEGLKDSVGKNPYGTRKATEAIKDPTYQKNPYG